MPGRSRPKRGMAATKARPPLKPGKDGVVRLAGGNPQIAKAEGNAPVQKYIAALEGWKRDAAKRVDALVTKTIPGVKKAVKWNSPFYSAGEGWFMAMHSFNKAVKVTFFRGTSLKPPPAGGKSKDARWIDVHEDDLDEAQLVAWIRQAAAIPGWGGGPSK